MQPDDANATPAPVLVAALVFLQLAVAAFYWLADARLATVLAPTGDVVGLLVVVALWSALVPAWRAASRAIAVALSLVVLSTLLVALGQGLLRREFGQDLLLVVDVRYVSSLVKLLFDNEPHLRFAAWCLAAFAVVALAILLPYRLVRALHHRCAGSRPRQATLAAAALGYYAVAALLFGVHRPVAAEAGRQLVTAARWKQSVVQSARRLDAEAPPALAPRLDAGDAARPPRIYLFVVESYGEVLFEGRAPFAGFPAFLDKQANALAAAGYQMRSKYLRSPVFGSGSWMPDATSLCGVRIDNQKRFVSLFESNVRCLPQILRAAGYRTLMAAANTEQHEPRLERTYGFDRYYFRDDLPYAGPRFGWSFAPDQFVIDFIHRTEIAPRAGEPLFVEMVLTSSHVPWNALPPHVDWDAIGDGALYRTLPARRFDNWLTGGGEREAGYLAGVEYSLQSIAEYLARLPADDRSLVVILGDHQPRTPIGDRFRDPWSVPVHVLGRDAHTVERFAALGYTGGLVPAPSPSPPGLERLMSDLVVGAGGHAP